MFATCYLENATVIFGFSADRVCVRASNLVGLDSRPWRLARLLSVSSARSLFGGSIERVGPPLAHVPRRPTPSPLRYSIDMAGNGSASGEGTASSPGALVPDVGATQCPEAKPFVKLALEEGLEKAGAVQYVYFVTISRVLLSTWATHVGFRDLTQVSREDVAMAVKDALAHPLAGPRGGRPRAAGAIDRVKALVVFKELHADESVHYHVVVRLASPCRFEGAKRALRERHGMPSHWSCTHTQLWSALRRRFSPVVAFLGGGFPAEVLSGFSDFAIANAISISFVFSLLMNTPNRWSFRQVIWAVSFGFPHSIFGPNSAMLVVPPQVLRHPFSDQAARGLGALPVDARWVQIGLVRVVAGAFPGRLVAQASRGKG